MILDPEKYYTINELYKLHVFPWCRSYSTLKRYLLKHREELDPYIEQHAMKQTYLFKGSNILKYGDDIAIQR